MDQQLDYQEHNLPSTQFAPTERGVSIEGIINAWLNEVAKSPKTEKSYRDTINQFRLFLQGFNKDLIYKNEHFDVEVADFAQAFAKVRLPGSRHTGKVTPATEQQRLAVLSSFYLYARKRRHITSSNPIDLVNRPSVEAYGASEALSPEEISQRLSTIDLSTQQGRQDRSILIVLLFTGRRASEIANLRRERLEKHGNQIKLNFINTKGGKSISDMLEPEITAILDSWLEEKYQGQFWNMPADTPLWVDLYHTSRQGEPLNYHGIANACQRWLGTSKVHTTRGTFTILMEEAGAKLTDIQQRLQHENAATTGIYANKLKRHQNRYAGKMVELLGLKEK